MSKTLIISPTIFEAAPIFSGLGERHKPKVGDCAQSGNIVCLVSGIGCERSAERVKSALERFNPTDVILAGFCGACGKKLKNGDLIYETSSSDMVKIGIALRGIRGKIACVDKIADTQKKLELGAKGYDGVEMERDFFDDAIKNSKINFAHFRWISDSLDSDIPPDFFESTMDKVTGEIKLSAINLIMSICKSPKLLINLAKFGAEISSSKRIYENSAKKLVKLLRNEQ